MCGRNRVLQKTLVFQTVFAATWIYCDKLTRPEK